MQLKKQKHLPLYFCSFLLLSCTLTAAPAEENKEIGTEQLPAEVFSELSQAEESAAAQSGEREERLSNLPNKTEFMNFFYSFSSYLRVETLLDDEYEYGCLKTDDGARWKIAYEDQRKTSGWYPGDSLAIVVDQSWNDAVNTGKKFFYRLVNLSSRSEVKANLFIGPNLYRSSYCFVLGFNKPARQVSLSDGLTYIVCEEDMPLLARWSTNETVIKGSNASIFTSYKDILINVDYNHYVRVKPLY
jgi:hypothetical protein